MDHKERMYSYQELELLAMKYAVRTAVGLNLGETELPKFEVFLPIALRELQYEIIKASSQSESAGRLPTQDEGSEG